MGILFSGRNGPTTGPLEPAAKKKKSVVISDWYVEAFTHIIVTEFCFPFILEI